MVLGGLAIQTLIHTPPTSRPYLVRQIGQSSVTALSWSPDGKLFAAGGAETITVWDAKSRELVSRLAPHVGPINAVAWSPRGESLAFASFWGIVGIWNIANDTTSIQQKLNLDNIRSLHWNSSGTILTAGDVLGRVVALDPKSVNIAKKYELHTYSGRVYSYSWSSDGKLIATASPNKRTTKKDLF